MSEKFVKEQVEYNEFALALLASKAIGIKTPKILSYNEQTKVMIMNKMKFSNVADFYGDGDDKTPDYIYTKIRKIIKKLYDYGIIFPDITGYNFLLEEKSENIWIIDFGHAYVKAPDQPDDEFIIKFINGKNGWNPNFK